MSENYLKYQICNCFSYNKGDYIDVKGRDWVKVKDVYMGTLYQCPQCKSLWVAYMCGHGWMRYYKTDSDEKFNQPFKSDSESSETAIFNLLKAFSADDWHILVQKFRLSSGLQIGNQLLPEDIATVVRGIFKDDTDFRKWFFKSRINEVQFLTPMEIYNKSNNLIIIKVLLMIKANDYNKN